MLYTAIKAKAIDLAYCKRVVYLFTHQDNGHGRLRWNLIPFPQKHSVNIYSEEAGIIYIMTALV